MNPDCHFGVWSHHFAEMPVHAFEPLASRLLLGLHLCLWLLLAAYGLHRLHLLRLYRRVGRGRATPRDLNLQAPSPASWPTVTIQLPVFNERYVIERLLDAAAAVDYPRDRLEIQVLDDSTDETCEIAARKCDELRARGIEVAHLRREGRAGYKAGALQLGLARARGDLLAIFDADFVPPPGILRAMVP